jgi:hypothetical protein
MQITLDLTKHPVLAKVLAAYGRSQGMSVQDAICENLYDALNLKPGYERTVDQCGGITLTTVDIPAGPIRRRARKLPKRYEKYARPSIEPASGQASGRANDERSTC